MATQPISSGPAVTREAASARSISGVCLSGRTLLLARAAWLTVAAFVGTIYVAGVLAWLGQVNGTCPPGVCIHGQVTPAVAREFAAAPISVNFYGWYNLGLNVFFAVGFATVAAVIFWRRSHDLLALFTSLTLLVFALGSFEGGVVTAALTVVGPGWWLPVATLSFIGEFAFGIFVAIFPDGRFVPRWTRLVMVPFALWWLPNVFFSGSPFDFVTWPGWAFFGGWAFFLSVMGAAQVYRYRYVSTPAQRLQTKWVVFGFVAAAIGYFMGRLIVFFLTPMGPGYWPPLTSPQTVLVDLAGGTLIYASMLLIPICIGIAMLRYHLFDIDVIIRRTLIYSIVTGTLATVYAISGILLQAGFYALTGQGSALAVVGSTLAIAALFQPVRNRVQAIVDRRFYRRKYDAVRTVAAFGVSLRSEVDMAQVSDKLVTVVEETMQPSQVSLWLVRPDQQAEPGAWGRRVDAAEVEAARVPKPVPLPGLFAAP